MGTADFTWAITSPVITGSVTIASPGAWWNETGTAITPLALVAMGTEPGATFTWSATGLPAGLSLAAANGTITGSPTTAGTYPVTLTATDISGLAGTTGFTWTITQASLPISPTSRATAEVGSAFNETLAVIGGKAPYTWSVTAGSLPVGLALGKVTGTISGKPSVAGTSTFTVTATDATLYGSGA